MVFTVVGLLKVAVVSCVCVGFNHTTTEFCPAALTD